MTNFKIAQKNIEIKTMQRIIIEEFETEYTFYIGTYFEGKLVGKEIIDSLDREYEEDFADLMNQYREVMLAYDYRPIFQDEKGKESFYNVEMELLFIRTRNEELEKRYQEIYQILSDVLQDENEYIPASHNQSILNDDFEDLVDFANKFEKFGLKIDSDYMDALTQTFVSSYNTSIKMKELMRKAI